MSYTDHPPTANWSVKRWLCAQTAIFLVAAVFVALCISEAQLSPAAAKDKARLTLQLAHTSRITALAYAPDGKLFASGADDGTIKIWEVETGRQIRTLAGGGAGPINSLSFSSNGKLLSSQNIWISIWDMDKQEPPMVIGGCCKSAIPEIGDGEHFDIEARFTADGKSILSTNEYDTPVMWSLTKTPKARPFLPKKKPQKIEGLAYTSVTLSPDGRLAASLDLYGRLTLWSVDSGTERWSVSLGNGGQASVSFSPDGQFILAGPIRLGSLVLVQATSGKVIRRFSLGTAETENYITGFGIFCGKNSRYVVAPKGQEIVVWDMADGRRVRDISLSPQPQNFMDIRIACSPDGQRLLSAARYDTPIRLWNIETGNEVRSYSGFGESVRTTALSQDSKLIISGGSDGVIRFWDASTGRLMRTLAEDGDVWLVRFLPDGRHFMSGGKEVKIRSIDTGATVATLADNQANFYFNLASNNPSLLGDFSNKLKLWEDRIKELNAVILAVSDDGSRIAKREADGNLVVWDLATDTAAQRFPTKFDAYAAVFSTDGRTLVSWTYNEFTVWDLASARAVRTFPASGGIKKLVMSSDGKTLLSGGRDSTARLWDIASGRQIAEFQHNSAVSDIGLAANAKVVITASADGTVGLWKVDGQLLAKFAGLENNWLTSTGAGYFERGGEGELPVHIVRGFNTISIAQVFDHLYRPDLVAAQLIGDPEGKHENAAHQLNLDEILDSGPAPQLEFLEKRTERIGDTTTVSARLTSQGGGVGSRIVWRVNGVVQGNPTPKVLLDNGSSLASVVVSETFRLPHGPSALIELVAYNRAGLIASSPLRITVDQTGVTSEMPPRMFVLALGVDQYRMDKYKLNYAASDALSFARAMSVVGSSLFSKVIPITLTDEEVSEPRIAKAIDDIASQAQPRDALILFLGGHGISVAGRYYYYPQGLDFAAGQTVQEHGISQAKWETWLAKIPVQNSLLVIDTCEGAAFRGVRGPDEARQTAMAHLQRATGRNIIAASREAAFEGYRGHGLLTFAVLEALERAKSATESAEIRVSALASYVGDVVPKISQSVFGLPQLPTLKLIGNDFPIGIRGQVVSLVGGGPNIPKDPNWVMVRNELVRGKPLDDAQTNRPISAGALVRAVDFAEGWVLIAREGQKLGWVPRAALTPIQ